MLERSINEMSAEEIFAEAQRGLPATRTTRSGSHHAIAAARVADEAPDAGPKGPIREYPSRMKKRRPPMKFLTLD